MRKILIITSTYDRTCDYILSKYLNVEFFRLNLDRFSEYRISVNANGFIINHNSGSSITEKDCISIYYRKPSPENLMQVFGEEYQQFCHRESYSIVEGIVESFEGTCLSKPSIMRRSGNKVFQAKIVRQVGFLIPDYLITNSHKSLDFFYKNKSIVKPLSTGMIERKDEKEIVQTNVFKHDIDLSALKYSPVYFQKYIPKDYECRATFVGDKEFSVKIESENDVDWRKRGNKIDYSECTLPNNVHKKCLQFMKYCNMEFGCFDFIVNDDTWYFLEMNVNGQWAWLEFEAKLNISKAIVEHLRK